MRDYTILKRDGKRDRFSLDKIMTAIIKAFQSVGESADLGTISKIISHLNITDTHGGQGNHGAVEIFGRLC